MISNERKGEFGESKGMHKWYNESFPFLSSN